MSTSADQSPEEFSMFDTGDKKLLAPQMLTMDRLDERDELIVAQSTSQCCRKGCCQPSINWLIAEGNNYEPGMNPFQLDSVGWIHEESSFQGRCCSGCAAGFRKIKYVQHYGPTPTSLMNENTEWCTCQFEKYSKDLTEEDRKSNVVLTHEKNNTCGVYFCNIPFLCNECNLPYLETKDANGNLLGRTQYICDACLFVPKYDILDANGNVKYRLRPDTCVAGLCVQCRCDGKKGKCCRVPFVIRDPYTKEPISSDASFFGRTIDAMIDVLWTGWANECCTKKNAYHVSFPTNITPEEKAVIIGSTLLVDLTMFEQEQDDNN